METNPISEVKNNKEKLLKFKEYEPELLLSKNKIFFFLINTLNINEENKINQ